MAEYISREAAKNILLQHQHRFTCADEANGYGSVKWSEDVIYLSEAVNGMDAIHAADVRPMVKGKWMPDYDYAEYDFDGSTPLLEPRKYQDGWQCSLCGQYMPSKENYCPNCGADMRGEQDV